MKKILLFIVLILTLSTQAQTTFKAKWDNGFKVESEDKNFVLKFGGRIYYDVAFFFQDSLRAATFGKLTNGHEFRSTRLYHSGTIYKNFKYKFNLDFASGKVTFKDVFVEYTKIPVIGNIRVGHFYTPIGLEANTSSKYISFMENATLSSFSPSRNTGILIYNSFLDKKINASIGAYRYTDKFGNDKDAKGGVRLHSKISSALINDKETKTVLHLGVAYEYAHSKDSIFKLGTTPESHLGNKNIKGKITANEHTDLMNVEAVFVKGPFSIQSEFSLHSAHQYDGTTELSDGFYVFASYLLTGESRNYKGASGFSRIKPKNNVGKDGFGALELLIRYSRLDARNVNTSGLLNNYTAGINWYLNPSARIMVNYVHSSFDNDGLVNPLTMSTIQTRFQVDF